MDTRVENPEGSEVVAERSQRKTQPEKGKRYSPAQRKEILEYAGDHSVKAAAEKFGATETTIYEWRRAIKRRSEPAGEGENGDKPSERVIEDPKEERDRKILAMWRQHPGYGPSQVRNMLKRDGFKVSVGTVRDVMERSGYLPPSIKRKEHVGRYESARPRELYHLDFYHFHVHKQKQCVLFIEDDFSRFIAGWTVAPVEAADPVIACFEQSVQRYGRPEGVMSDRGSAFHSWRGLSRFEALLEEYEINYFLAKEAAVKGVMRSVQLAIEAFEMENQTYPIDNNLPLESLCRNYLMAGNYIATVPKNPFTGKEYKDSDAAGRVVYSYDATSGVYKLSAYNRSGTKKIEELSNM